MRTKEEILQGESLPYFLYKCKTDFKFFAERLLGVVSNGGIHEFQMDWVDASLKYKKLIIEAPTGSSKCLVGDTLIKTSKGFERADKIEPGTAIYSMADNYKIVEDRVVARADNGKKQTYKITLRSGKSITCTSNHPLRTIYGWKTIDDGLRVGDSVANARILENKEYEDLTDAEIKILAYLIAEGSLGAKNCAGFSNKDEKVVEDMNSALREFNGTELTYYSKYDYGLRGIMPWLRRFGLPGHNSKNLFIPQEIFKMSPKKMALFLNRLWECDGYIGNARAYPAIGYSSSSKRLILDVQLLLSFFGIPSYIKKRINTQHGYDIPCYVLTIETQEGMITFLDKIGTFNKDGAFNAARDTLNSLKSNPNVDTIPMEYILPRLEKSGNFLRRKCGYALKNHGGISRARLKGLSEHTNHKEFYELATSDVYWDPVVKIEDAGVQQTWDIQVESNNHNFIANGIITHNTEVMAAMYPIWLMTKENNKKILLLCKTLDQSSSNMLSRIKNYINDNEILQELLIPDDARSTWNASEIRTKNGHWIRIVPYNPNIRGFRADLIIADEIDSYEDTNLFFEHVLSRLYPDGQIIGISTPVESTRIIGLLKEKQKAGLLRGWKFIKTAYLVDEKGKPGKIEKREDIYKYKSIWPEWWPLDKLSERWGDQSKANWLRNHMCEAVGEIDDAIFPIEYILKSFDYNLGFSETVNQEAEYFIGVDLAISEGQRADYDAYVVIEKYRGQYIIKKIETYRGLDTIPKINRLEELYNIYYSDAGTYMVIDKSNVGIPVIRGLQAIGIPAQEGSFHSIARKQLYRTLSSVLSSGRLVIPRSPHTDCDCVAMSEELKTQMVGFRRAKSLKTGNEMIESRAKHDDCTSALALAIAEAVQHEEMDLLPVAGN